MPLNAQALKTEIKSAIESKPSLIPLSTITFEDLWDAVSNAIIDHITNNLSITISPGDVIISVSGGSGSPAVGTPNTSPIDCDVS